MKRYRKLSVPCLAVMAMVSCGTADVPAEPDPGGRPAPYNAMILQTIKEMPKGGGYTVRPAAEIALRASISGINGRLVVKPEVAKPS